MKMQVSTKKRRNFSIESLRKITFFIYLCALGGHKSGVGFDAFFSRFSLVAFVGVEIISILTMRRKRQRYLSKALVWYFSFVVFYLISATWSSNIDDVLSISYLNNFIQILCIAFVLSPHLRSKERVEDYLRLVLLSLIYMVALLAIKTPIGTWGSTRVGEVLFLNANDLGMRCAMGMLISLYFSQNKKAYYSLVVIFTAVALFSGSRKAFIMVLVGTVVFGVGKSQGWRVLRSILLASVFVVVLINLVMENEILYKIMGKRIEQALNFIFNPGGQMVVDFSSLERTFFRNQAWEMFKQKPVLGWGANGFVTQMRSISYSHVAYSHSNYYELLATLGIFGFSMYYYMQTWIIIKSVGLFFTARSDIIILAISVVLVNLIAEYYYVSYASPFTQILIVVLFFAVEASIVEKSNYSRTNPMKKVV